MLEFLTANWDSVLLVVAFVVLIIFLLKRGYTTQVNEILFYLVSKAEQELGRWYGSIEICCRNHLAL